MEKNKIIAFGAIQLILILSFVVIATNENDTTLNEQNDSLCTGDCLDCSNTCTNSCECINQEDKTCDSQCVQSGLQSKEKNYPGKETCSGSGACGQRKNIGNCKTNSGCSGSCP